ncbi:hypothetical protein ABT112_16640 [Streptomyces sp. NPDC002055]|uniref:hypothetical protein n=1 Tax=Streptomyces sp. NPDC002055 TaxID=3154534 RepID=UPI0033219E20
MTAGPGSAPAVPLTLSADEPDVWFVLPPGFFPVSLDGTAEERVVRMAEAVEALFPDAAPEQRLSLVLSGEYAVASMLGAGAVHLSHCLRRRDDGGLSQGMLAVFIKHLGSSEPLGMAQSIADQWFAENPDAEVGGVILPYGPAALCAVEHDIPVPAALFGAEDGEGGGGGQDGVTTLRQVQLAVPLHTGRHTLVFAFSTEDIDQWDNYLQVMAELLCTVSADEPVDRPEDRPDAGLPDLRPDAGSPAPRPDAGSGAPAVVRPGVASDERYRTGPDATQGSREGSDG